MIHHKGTKTQRITKEIINHGLGLAETMINKVLYVPLCLGVFVVKFF
jgi:hypothetical protein